MPAEKKRRVNYFSTRSSSESSSDADRKPSRETLEKSLTNLQINLRVVAGKMEEMMTTFEQFSEGFKANQTILMEDMKELMEDMKELNQHAIDIKNQLH